MRQGLHPNVVSVLPTNEPGSNPRRPLDLHGEGGRVVLSALSVCNQPKRVSGNSSASFSQPPTVARATARLRGSLSSSRRLLYIERSCLLRKNIYALLHTHELLPRVLEKMTWRPKKTRHSTVLCGRGLVRNNRPQLKNASS